MGQARSVTWSEMGAARPDLTQAGHDLLYQVGVGLAFLATSRPDGGPRVHPMCPILDSGAMHAFIVKGPKQRDLLRDGRYALHSFPCPDNEDAFYVTGRAALVEGTAERQCLSEVFVGERAAIGVPPPGPEELLFELRIESCMLTRTSGHGDPSPRHEVWRPE